MYPLWDELIAPLVRAVNARRVVEIGALRGETTVKMLHDLGGDCELHVIDPLPQFDPTEHERAFPGRYFFHLGISHDVLPTLPQADVVLVDGDHNWYTVYNELNLISERDLVRKGGVVFLHDVDAPWGRRDMYYQPDTIPAEYQQEWEPVPSLAFKRAKHEGGQRNGVLTAIEDFLQKHRAEYRFFHVKAGHGLGMIQRRGTFSDNLAFLFLECKGFLFNAAIKLMKLAKMEFHRNKTKRMGLGYRA